MTQRTTLTGTFVDGADAPQVGTTLAFTPSVQGLRDTVSDEMIVPRPLTTTVNSSGAFSIVLPSTDGNTLNVTDWTYRVDILVPGQTKRSFSISLPAAVSPVDIGDLAPVTTSSTGTVVLVPGPTGPQGDPATNLITSVAGRTGAVTLAQADIAGLPTALTAEATARATGDATNAAAATAAQAAATAAQATATAAYVKPGSGIPSTDMAAAVVTSLGRADALRLAAAPSGGDDTAALAAALAAGSVLLRPNVTYLVTSLTVAAGTVLDLNGSTVKRASGTASMILPLRGSAVRNGTLDANNLAGSLIRIDGGAADVTCQNLTAINGGTSSVAYDCNAAVRPRLLNCSSTGSYCGVLLAANTVDAVVIGGSHLGSTCSAQFNASFYVNSATGAKISDVTVASCAGGGCFVGTATDVVFTNCTFNSNGTLGGGLYRGVSLDPNCKRITFIGCRADGNDIQGFYSQTGSVDVTLIGCTARGNNLSGTAGQHGFEINSVGYAVSGCVSSDNIVGNPANPAGGFYLGGSKGTVTNCVATGNYGRGFYVYHATDVTLTGCVAVNNSQAGAGLFSGFDLNGPSVASTTNVSVVGCLAYDSQGTQTQAYGLRVSGTSVNQYIVTGCNFLGNLTGAILDLGGLTKAVAGNLGGGSSPAASANVTEYTTGGAAGFFTMSSGAKFYEVEMIAGGTGGGSGRKGAAGTVRCGGGGGGGAALTKWTLTAAELLALYPTGQVPYQVALGAAGGAAVSAADTNGNAGTTAGTTNESFFGPLFARAAASAGSGGTNAAGAGGSAGLGSTNGSAGASASTTGGVGVTAFSANGGPGGGGSGGGLTSGDVTSAGGASRYSPIASSIAASPAGGVGGTTAGVLPTSGTAPAFFAPGTGAGGGASSTTGNGQDGADALHYGGGGGGGGAALNAVGNSGRGGNGGNGRIRITEGF